MRYVSWLNSDGNDNLLDVPALSDSGFELNYGHDKTWRVITPQGKAIFMGEFAGSWHEPEVSVRKTAHSFVMFLREMWGVDPTDETFDAKAELAANKVENALGGRNGRLRISSDTEECHPQRNTPRTGQVESYKGFKDKRSSEGGSCSPSDSEHQGVHAINPGVRGSKAAPEEKMTRDLANQEPCKDP